jgi:hypothetical protein
MEYVETEPREGIATTCYPNDTTISMDSARSISQSVLLPFWRSGLTPGQLANDHSIGTSLKYRVALLRIVSTSTTMDWTDQSCNRNALE